MNKTIWAWIAMMCVGVVLNDGRAADSASVTLSLASPPNPGHWKETTQPTKSSEKMAKTDKLESPYPLSREVTLVGAMRQEIVSWSSGETTEQWIVDGVMFEQLPGKKGVYIHDPRMDAAQRVPSLTSWSGLEWVRPGGKATRGSYKGQGCVVWEQSTEGVVMRLRVDEVSHLPLSAEASGLETQFEFLSPPAQSPAPSGAYAATILGYKKKLDSMTVNARPR